MPRPEEAQRLADRYDHPSTGSVRPKPSPTSAAGRDSHQTEPAQADPTVLRQPQATAIHIAPADAADPRRVLRRTSPHTPASRETSPATPASASQSPSGKYSSDTAAPYRTPAPPAPPCQTHIHPPPAMRQSKYPAP